MEFTETRDAVLPSGKTVSLKTVVRDYRCALCNGRLTENYYPNDPRFPGAWGVKCVACDSTNFVSTYQAEQNEADARALADAIATSPFMPQEIKDQFEADQEPPLVSEEAKQEARKCLYTTDVREL